MAERLDITKVAGILRDKGIEALSIEKGYIDWKGKRTDTYRIIISAEAKDEQEYYSSGVSGDMTVTLEEEE